MKTLLNKIDVKSTFWDNTFLLGKIILVLTFSANVGSALRILPLYKIVKGEVIEVANRKYTQTVIGGNDRMYDCMALKIDSFKRRIIHRKPKYSALFKQGDEVQLWYYRMHGEYIIVQAKRGNEILIKHNGLLANIVFVLMVGSFLIVLFELFLNKILPKNKDG